MKIACCGAFMTVKTQGISVLELASFGPYKLWSADAYECKICGTVVAAGFAERAYAEHYQPDFQMQLERAKASDKLFTV